MIKPTTICKALIVLLVTATLAAAQQVATQYDRGVNFTNFHTYKWATIEGAEQPDQITAQNIQGAINAQLQAKLLSMVQDNPDLLGSVTKSLNPSSNPDKNYKNLQKAIEKLLKKFPPQ